MLKVRNYSEAQPNSCFRLLNVVHFINGTYCKLIIFTVKMNFCRFIFIGRLSRVAFGIYQLSVEYLKFSGSSAGTNRFRLQDPTRTC